MKSNFYKFKITFAIIFGTLLSISPFNPVRLTNPKDTLEVCAQDIGWEDLGTGVSCVPNYSSCGSGFNILESALGARYVNGISQSQLISSLEASYGTDINRICTTENFSDITIRWMTGGEYNAAQTQNIPSVGDTLSGKAIPRFCPAGWQAQIGTQRFNFATGYPSGCCPTGFKFVNVAEQQDPSASQNGVCCRLPTVSGVGTPHKYATSEFGGTLEIAGCYDENENLIYAVDDAESQSPSRDYSTLADAIEAAEEGNIIVGIKQTAGGYNPSVSFAESSGNSTTVVKPQLGLGFGLAFPGNINTIAESKLSKERCRNNVGCFISSAGIVSPRNIVGSDGVNVFDNPSNSSLTCERCFSPGEPVEVDTTTNLLSICDPTAPNAIREQPLCNSSVIDTIACLGGSNSTSQNANSDGVGSTNYDLCCACRVQGGVWTGIGCTDTTPAGLITGLIRIVYGVMGGVALIMLIYAGIMYQTGNEANVKQARESIIRTITGLIVLTFSILILRIIGINVLDILPSGSI